MGEVIEKRNLNNFGHYVSGYYYSDETGEEHQIIFPSDFFEKNGRFFRTGYLSGVVRTFEYNKLDDGSYEFKD